MPVRRIKGAPDDLYADNSDACHLALRQLEDFLRDIIGFYVRTKPARETTLRVYPTKTSQYPLLNPRFCRNDSDDFEFLEITVWSKGDRRALHRYLKASSDFLPCDDFDPTGKPEKNSCHGWFILPVRFKAKEIDFKALGKPLGDLLQFLKKAPQRDQPSDQTETEEEARDEYRSSDEVSPGVIYKEGATTRITVNAYERNAEARRVCIAEYGTACAVCGFDFGEVYGELGKGFTHVHHLKDLATIGEEYEVDPVRDLRPVCPNCHAMLHREVPAMSIKKLRGRLQKMIRPS